MNSFLIVGRADCPIPKVYEILRSSPSFHFFRKEWTGVARNLDIPEDKIEAIKQALLLDTVGLNDALNDILNLWVSGKGNAASLEKLVQSLKRNGLTDCAQRLQAEFKLCNSRIKKYVCIPSALENLLTSSDFPSGLIILTTFDITITMEKIRENLKDCKIFLDFDSLLTFVCEGNEWSILVVGNANPNTLPDLLDNMSGNKPFDQTGKVVLVTDIQKDRALSLLSEESISLNYVKVISDKMEWNDLNLKAKHEVRKRAESYVGFRLQNESLESALSGQTLVDLINKKNDLQLIKSGLPDKVSYYITRNLLTRNIISEEAFKSSGKDVFIFQGISRSDLSLMIKGKVTANSSEQLQRLSSKFVVLDHPHHFTTKCQLSNNPIHLVRKESDDKWSWIKSNGAIGNIQKHVSERKAQNKFDENALLKQMSKRTFEENIPVCISDSPGMGKSFLLAQIGRKLEETFPERIVAFVVFPELVKEVQNQGINEIKEAVKLGLAKLAGENSLGELFLKFKLDAEDKIWIELLLDGFDEVDYYDNSVSHEILKTIKSFISVRLWITSRPHLLEELEQTLCVLGYNMQPFHDNDQITFLARFWGDRFKIQKTKFLLFASTCLNILKNSMNSSDEDIAGIPLQCLMIAEIFQDEAKANAGLNNPTTSTKTFTFIDLYDLLMKKKMELYFNKYDGADKLTQAEILDIHKWLSLQLLFPAFADKVLPLSEQVRKYSEDILKIGLLEASSTLASPRFIHRTFAEYLTAVFAFEVIEKQTCLGDDFAKLLYDHLFANNLPDHRAEFIHPVICYFLNFLILRVDNVGLLKLENRLHFSTAQNIIRACVVHSFSNIFKLFNDNAVIKKYQRFIFEKDLLFACVARSNLELLRIVFEHFERHYEFTEEAKKELFRLSVYNMKFSIIEFLLKEKECEEIVKRNDSTEYVRSLLVLCVSETHKMDDLTIGTSIQIMRIILNLNKHETQNNLKHLIFMDNIHIKIIKELITLGADLLATNDRHWNNNTIFHTASRWLDAVEYEELIKYAPSEKLKYLLLISNASGATPLNTLVERERIKVTFATLNLFNAAGADFNSCDNSGNSVLSKATKFGRSRETLRNLVRFGASVNWKGKNGEGLLHLAVKHSEEALTYYLDELELDPNEADSNGMTPMDYSILEFIYERDVEIEKLLSDRGGLSSIGYLSVKSNLEINYKKAVAVTKELLKVAKGNQVDYLRDLALNKSELEIKHLLIKSWVKVSKNNSILKWIKTINKNLASSVDIIKHLEEQGADLFQKDSIGQNFLHKLLVSGLVFLDWHPNYDKNMSHLSSNFHQIFEYLVEHNYANLFSMAEKAMGSSPLHIAARNIELDNKTFYLFRNANISFGQVDSNGNNLLVYAVKGMRSNEMLTNLINFGVDWKCINLEGWNLLHHAANEKNISGLKYFISLGLSLKDVDKKGRCPFMIYLETKQNKNLKLAQLFCQFGTDTNAKDNNGMTSFDYLIEGWQCYRNQRDRIATLKYFIDKGADIYAQDANNHTFIHKWISKDVSPDDFHEFVEFLIQKKMWSALEVGGLDHNCTPLHLAIKKMEIKSSTLALLHSVGVNFNSSDGNGNSLLTYSIDNGSLQLIDWLINYGADMFHLDKSGRSILHVAAQNGSAESLLFLIKRATIDAEEFDCEEKGVDQYITGLDRQDNDGNTPLHCAMLAEDIKGLEDKASALIEAGADVGIKNNKGHYPFDVLERSIYKDSIKNNQRFFTDSSSASDCIYNILLDLAD